MCVIVPPPKLTVPPSVATNPEFAPLTILLFAPPIVTVALSPFAKAPTPWTSTFPVTVTKTSPFPFIEPSCEIAIAAILAFLSSAPLPSLLAVILLTVIFVLGCLFAFLLSESTIFV